MYSIGELRPGMTIQLDDTPYLIVTAQHSKMARGGGIAKTTLKNLLTGNTLSKTFQGNEKLISADVGYSKAQYLYSDSDAAHFMNNTNYEQFSISLDQLGNQKYYLLEGTDVDIQNFDGKPISIKLPPKINIKVIETEPGVRGNTAQSGTKPAILETGLRVQVPLFINMGDTIRVNTETDEYSERV